MFKLVANAAVAVSLLLSASGTAPARAEKTHDAKCTAAKHRHVKRTIAGTKARPGPGAVLVNKTRLEVQILSFGP